MSDLAKRLGVLRDMRRKHLSQLRSNASMPDKDSNGSASNSLAGTLRFLAVADYSLDKSVEAFRSQAIEATELRRCLFERFDSGDPVSPSYVSMMSYKSVFNALAAGNGDLAKSFATSMGGRDSVESEYDRPFDIALGYSLKSLLVADDLAAAQWIKEFSAACREPDNADFQGYAKVLQAVLDKDSESAAQGVEDVIVGHKRQSKVGGLFKDTEDELLCVWGIGVANLARLRGVPIQVDDPLIPSDLLV